MTDDSAGLMLLYGTQLAIAGVAIPGGPLLNGDSPGGPGNVVSLAAARTGRATSSIIRPEGERG